MKRTFITVTIAFFAVMSFAQPSAETSIPANDSVIIKNESADRITKLENDVKQLKASNELLQKQVTELKYQLPVKKKKLGVSRTSSKGPVWIEE